MPFALLRLSRALLAAVLLALTAFATAMPARAAVELVMFEQTGCAWCARWNADIAPIYPKTDEGKAAPLRRVDIHAALPADMQLARRPQFTPTFVVLQDGVEVGRIEGYPGEDFFWGLLDRILSTTGQPAAGAAVAAPKS